VRELPRLGYLINAHASLLPRYRGASPIAQAILDGERETGVSVMRVEREMDSGPVALTRRLEIGAQENTAELTERLSRLAADAIADALEAIAAERVEWTEQDHARASVAPKLAKSDGALDWHCSTAILVSRIHGLAPKPGAFTQLLAAPGADDDDDDVTLRILRARPSHAPDAGRAAPGTVCLASCAGEPAMRIATGDGWLEPLELQKSGGRAIDSAAFLRGFDLPDGTLLGSRSAAAEAEAAHV
jgi:methionyl-tRNA formyltransferase